MNRADPVPAALDPLAARPANEAAADTGDATTAGAASESARAGASPAGEAPKDVLPQPAVDSPGTAGAGGGAPPASAAPRAGRSRDIAIGVLGVCAFALAIAAYDAHRDHRKLRQELAQRLAATDDLGRQSQSLALGAQRTVREMEASLASIQAQLAESQSQQIALEALYQDLARGRDEAALAEIEQSLITANQQLVLAGNVKVALIALQSADSRLALIDRAQFAPLRRALAMDIERLQGVPLVDMVGIAMRLDRAVAGIDLLPTTPGTGTALPDTDPRAGAEDAPAAAPAPAPAPAAAGGWRGTLQRLWAEFRTEFRQLASIRRIDQDALPLIAPEQSWFLRENLRLRLLSARHALLARDESGFRGDISVARGWIARYFDTRDPAAAALAETLRELEGMQIRVDLPEIGTSIEAVRALRVSRDRRQ